MVPISLFTEHLVGKTVCDHIKCPVLIITVHFANAGPVSLHGGKRNDCVLPKPFCQGISGDLPGTYGSRQHQLIRPQTASARQKADSKARQADWQVITATALEE